ncbi:hypothetical protein TraAM80_02220 [Trypanosoma rangeli]|uniref:PH domain-containing protein n=1 Tax=Trypanosoma rangeli TaxID=5698 RepID=A0A422NV61_TRYRA|nr:uncharacterized protein TraAM80_02220 [Trypanosoma rangeli]RNF09346.1 hypothetical protein TraAM80_02220 [Trypanosoma rangeli]|eukprot:RNF09346.1 hypothetical protein TraAM80_02220 [Trypanosoma rangeli]
MASAAGTHFILDFSFEILQRMLDEESLLLGQLAYVVGDLHDPILDGCGRMSASARPQLAPDSHRNNNNNNNGGGSSGGRSKSVTILSFAQYWDLFANIATLYGAQRTIVGKFEKAVSCRTHILEPHQVWLQSDQNAARGTPVGFSSDSRVDEEVWGAHCIPEAFCSAAMRHFMAEHMMYSLHYTRNIAPRVMELWRLWRCRFDKQNSAQLSAEERKQLESHMRFLRFLWDAFGNEAGVPSDPRVVCTRLPETPPASLSRRGGATITSRSGSYSKPPATSSILHEAPPIPPDWRGFETLLVLLATPLSSLRRYMHVARCIIESQCLSASVHQRLQTEFIDVVAPRVAEEQSLVFDEVAREDVAHIVELIDEVAAATPSGVGTAKTPRIRPDRDGSRTLVHYGRLVKLFRRGCHERLVFLFSDWFCYVEEQTNGRLRLCASIPLEALRVVDLDDTANDVNGFDIVTKERRLSFFAPTLEQKQQWVSALRITSEAYNVKLRLLEASQRHDGFGRHQRQHAAGGVALHTRATAPPLSHNSRLRRDQRADRALQRHPTAELATTAKYSAVESSADAPVVGSDVARNPWADLARSQRNSFDVTHWAQQSTDTVHRRVRSSNLLPSSWLLASPHEASSGEAEAVALGADPSSGKTMNTSAADADAAAIIATTITLSASSASARMTEGAATVAPPMVSVPLLISERFQEGSLSFSFSAEKSNSSFTGNLSRNEGREGAESVRSTLLSVIAATKGQRTGFTSEDEVVLDFND